MDTQVCHSWPINHFPICPYNFILTFHGLLAIRRQHIFQCDRRNNVRCHLGPIRKPIILFCIFSHAELQYTCIYKLCSMSSTFRLSDLHYILKLKQSLSVWSLGVFRFLFASDDPPSHSTFTKSTNTHMHIE